MSTTQAAPGGGQMRLLAARGTVLSVIKLFFLGLSSLPFLNAAPTSSSKGRRNGGGLLHALVNAGEPDPKPADDPTLWIYLTVAMVLVLLGGAFAGLTIALMGQDEIYLQVIRTSGDGAEKKNAAKVLKLLGRGKHWVLVTLLLGNVITNETLPIVLDRSLGGGWPAVLGSTVLIVIFGEIIPQSICVRHGLPIGAWMSPLVLGLMYVLAPAAWPTAKLLDWLLGEDHGTVYKKAGLKTLVTLHKSLGAAGEQLNADEVTIISAVLDLKEKPIGSIMTPMADVFTMSADTVLDEDTVDGILSAGYSRIPIHAPDNEMNFIGMLLVKILITYDPEDCKKVRDFALATLPETWPETSCLDIVNFFQEGKSHMILVSDSPGDNHGALGVATLEDVIEELIGEEIIDESDVYIDVHKSIRRITPAPRAPRYRMPKEVYMPDDKTNGVLDEAPELTAEPETEQGPPHEAIRRLTLGETKPDGRTNDSSPPPKRNSVARRTSSNAALSDRELKIKRADTPEMRERLKHIGPSNQASRPRQTRYNTVKIKPGIGGIGMAQLKDNNGNPTSSSLSKAFTMPPASSGGVGEGLLQSAGKDASDGAHAVQVGYGTLGGSLPSATKSPPKPPVKSMKSAFEISKASQDSRPGSSSSSGSRSPTTRSRPHSSRNKGGVRSGSITENIVETDGFKKVVLETTSSSEEPDGGAEVNGNRNQKENAKATAVSESETGSTQGGSGGKKKRRRKRKKGGKSESEPLLEGDEEE